MSDAERNEKSTWSVLKGEQKLLQLAKTRPNHRLEFIYDETGEGCKMPMTRMDEHVDTQTLLSSVVGTPQYMAKEMLQGFGYGAMVDWWSVGCILFEMLSGSLPFSGSSAELVFHDVLSDREIQFPPNMSANAEDLISGVSFIILCMVLKICS